LLLLTPRLFSAQPSAELPFFHHFAKPLGLAHWSEAQICPGDSANMQKSRSWIVIRQIAKSGERHALQDGSQEDWL
jgi:hypothetical protein